MNVTHDLSIVSMILNASVVVQASNPAGAIPGAATWLAKQGRRGEIATAVAPLSWRAFLACRRPKPKRSWKPTQMPSR